MLKIKTDNEGLRLGLLSALHLPLILILGYAALVGNAAMSISVGVLLIINYQEYRRIAETLRSY